MQELVPLGGGPGVQENVFSNSTAMPDIGWHFWTLTKQNGVFNWYHNAVFDATKTRTGTYFTPTREFSIGLRPMVEFKTKFLSIFFKNL